MIGGVYRGSRYSPALNGGVLLFGEFYDGYIRAVGVDANGDITDTDAAPGVHLVHAGAISSMVQGPDGYLYFRRAFRPGDTLSSGAAVTGTGCEINRIRHEWHLLKP